MQYEAVIGLEVHVQVRTASKMFCACPNRYGDKPNTNVCPVCLGYPGVLPVPNREAIRQTFLAGLMCQCDIALYSKFDRKSYFYPDMPKNYQISQYDLPFCSEGRLRIEGKALAGEVGPKDIGITRIHLEEDVAKSTHGSAYSGIDFNRAGVPLMETVSEPDMSTPDEAYAYLVALKQIMQYGGISDCDMEKGQMRCDVNVSVRPFGQKELNLKTEIKNLNSFKAVHRSLEYEIERQTQVLESAGHLRQETRGWNDGIGETYVMRTKESAHDYRYFPCPDLMPIETTMDELEKIREAMPEVPAARRKRFAEEYGLSLYDAGVLTQDRDCSEYFEACVRAGAAPKKAANWIMTDLLRELSQAGTAVRDCPVSPQQLSKLLEMVDSGAVHGKMAKEIFPVMFETGSDPDLIADEKGLKPVSDADAIDAFIQQVIAANPGPAAEFREGKKQALNFLVGQVMKLSRGKANPKLVAPALATALQQ